MHRHGAEVDPVEAHRTGVGAKAAQYAVEQRRLAGAVGPDETDPLAFGDPEGDIVEGTDTRKRLGDSHSIEENIHGDVSWEARSRSRRSKRSLNRRVARRFPYSTSPSG